MKLELLIALMFAVHTVTTSRWGVDEDEGVPVLTTQNFDQFLKDHPHVFVKFYAPWCGHCKKMIPDFQRLAKRMAEEADGVPVVKVDATVEKDIASKYGVKGFPSLKFFKNGQPIDYNGGRTDTDIYNYIRKKSGEAAKLITSDEELSQYAKQSLNVLFVLPAGEEAALNIFKALADSVEDLTFAYTHNTSYASTLGLTDKFNLIVFRDFDDGNKSTSSNTAPKLDDLKNFIGQVRFPIVMDFDQKVAEKIFGEKKPAIFMFSDDYNINEVAQFREVANELKGQIYFSLSKIKSGFGNKLAGMVDVNNGPSARIVEVGPSGINKYLVDDISIAGLKKAVEDFKAGKLTPFFKSEDIPTDNNEPVKVLVGNSFQSEVIDNDKFVLVEAYAPWCGHCKKLEPIYNELASKLAKHGNLVIAKMDATKNEFPGLNVRGYPSIVLYKPGNKKNPINYNKERSFALILEFLEEHMGNKLLDEDERVISTEL